MTHDPFSCDLLLSYARTPNAFVAREVERLLVAFHESRRARGHPAAMTPLPGR